LSICVFYPDSEPVPFRYAVPTRWSGEIPPPYDSSLLPQDYLEFAIEDMLGARPQNLVNAFGNIKRSMHFLIDCILYQYGVFTHHRTVNFPAKLRLLDGIGILPITLVRNLNIERNLLEHEYAIPSRKRVEEALDVAKLLLMATERLVVVNLQRRTSRRETVVNRGSGEVVIPITIPLPELPSKSWSELIDELLLKKTGDDENKKAN